jgi:integrase/recombinase XerD
MTPLRRSFIEDLQLRNCSPLTIKAYVHHLRELARHFNQSPEQLSDDQIHYYLVYLRHGKQVAWSSFNQNVAAIRFFYRVTCPRIIGVSFNAAVRHPRGEKCGIRP